KGLEWPHQLEITIDNERVFVAPVGGAEDNKMSDANFAAAADTIDARLKTRVSVKAGPHDVGVAFIRKNSAEYDEPLEAHTRDHDLQNMNGIPLIERMDLTGPFDATGPGDTPSRRKIFVCRPSPAGAVADETACAKKIISTLARRAYRQPASDGDVDLLMSFYQSGRKNGNFEAGIESALSFLLTAPKFLFRTESDPVTVPPSGIY